MRALSLLLLLCALVGYVVSQTQSQTCPRCTPLCQNGDGTPKTCGDDGCGGSCGTCSFGQYCCNGACRCQPQCTGRQCGDDGCGGESCGKCSPTQTCNSGFCSGTASRDCSGRVCGNDRNGGSCGSCPAGQRCRTGQCECYYDCNERNCGNAPQPDQTNFGLCPQRSCGTCPSGFTCGTNGRCSAVQQCAVSITVVDCSTRRAINSAATVSISMTSMSYFSTITVSSGVATTWNAPAIGTFSFSTSASGYQVNNQTQSVSVSTTAIELCVNPATVQIDVRNILTNVSIEVGATITYTGVISGSLRWNGVTTFTHGGFGSYSFTATPDSRYLVGTLNFQITSTTTLIIIYVQPSTVQVTVVDCNSRRALGVTSSVLITGSASYTTTLSVSGGSAASWTIPALGSFNFQTTASGYLTNTQSFTVGTTTSSIELCVSPAQVQLDVRNALTNVSIEVGATVQWTGVSSGSLRWSGITTFTHGGFGSYSFTAVPDSRYSNGNLNTQISATTTLIIIYVQPLPIPVTVVDCSTRRSLSVTSSVSISTVSYSTTLTVSAGGSASWTLPSYGSFTFTTTATGYLTNTQSFTVSGSTTGIEVCVSPAIVQVDVRERISDTTIEVGATVSYTGVISGSFRWNGVTTFTHGGYGSYSFTATPDSRYTVGTLSTSISASTTLIIIYVEIAEFCGNGVCAGTETASNCFLDCVSLFLEFENADGSGPVNGPTVNYFLSSPRDANADTGPNRNSVTATTTRTTGTGSNTVLEETYGYKMIVYFECVVNTFITFYWTANTSNIDSGLGIYRLRVHLSKTLGSTDFNYRMVNTWKPIDATPEPYGPTDLNLHLFHPSGALDINNPTLTNSGFAIGKAISDSKQSGGPATMDISPGAAEMVAVWNSKPPRNAAIAPSQGNRYLVDSGSYIVFYGKTSNAANGKQLGQVVMDDIFITNPSLKSDRSSDLWYVAQFTVNQPAVNQPSVVGQSKFKQSTVTSARDMFFDCEAYSYCNNFRVPYSDTGRREVEGDF